MGTHFYKFARSKAGTLMFQGKYLMKYFDIQEFGILFKDTEIENAKDLFNIGKYRTSQSGKTWLNNHLKNKK